MLLYDLSRSSKFLGNIILTIKSDHTCEIIDGQQRTTVLMLIVSCIKKKFGTKISTPDLCPLRNEGFTGFQTLLEKAFDQEAITSDDWNAILKSDDYHQLPRIQKLWNTISSSELLADRHKAQGLLDNLCKSEFNIIASYSNDVNTSIQYFLDVNLKGIRLDTEDIFKGYLFSQDSRELTRSLWQKNKRDVLRLNGVTQSSEEKRYPLMKLYEHFFYCDLYLPREGDCEYSTLKFGENFCLTSGFESGSTKYYEGSHLIEAIRDRDYLQNVLSRLNKCVEIMTDIIESEGPSTPFKDKFICAKKVDSIDIQNCHTFVNTSNVFAPLIEALQKTHSGTMDVRSIVVCAANAFESFLADFAVRKGVSLSGRNGILQKRDALSAHISKKHRGMIEFVGQVRNAADHGADPDENNQVWTISNETARIYPCIIAALIKAIFSRDATGSIEV